MPAELFSKLLPVVRTYRRRVANPSVRGIENFLKDTATVDEKFKLSLGDAERLWHAV